MLAQLSEEPFDDKNWVFEIKYDGYRSLALCDVIGNVQLYSRNQLSFNDAYPTIVEQLEKIGHQCLLDGEVVVEDDKGRSHFQLLQGIKQSGEAYRLKYYVFDILQLDGNDLTGLTLLERKELLKLLLKNHKLKNIFYSDHVREKGKDFFKQATKAGLEGIVAKRADSVYETGKRNGQWLKIKITNEQEAVIGGITHPQGARNYFGSLLLGVYEDNELQYIGNCGTGFDEKTLKELYSKFKPLFIAQSPFATPVKVGIKPRWLKPALVCQVKFTEWTKDGNMRHPVFLGLRKDKKAKEVSREKPKAMKATAAKQKEASGSDTELKVGKVTLKLTNQQKIYWPDEGISKGELVNYYAEMASVILPYLKDRPQSLNRFPNGIKAASFYQKDFDTKTMPDWLTTKRIYSTSNKAYIDYLVCNDKATLMYMANLGCIEINPWNSRINKLDNPDWVVIDLDPEAIAFTEVVKTALAVKKVCDKLDIACLCKTSGATGLHIYIPLAAKYEYEVARNFANLIAKHVHEMLPDITSMVRQPKLRQHKVYLDYLQNSKGQTLAAPYSVRPKAGATVSTPLDWKEVNSKLDPAKFTINTIFKRLDKVGDIWKPVLGKGVDIMKVIGKLEMD